MLELRVRPPYDPWTCSGCGSRMLDQPPRSVVAGLVCEWCLDRGVKGEPFIPLTVRPMAPAQKPTVRLVMAVSMAEKLCATEDGETFTLDELVDRIRERKSGEVGGHRYKPLPERLPPAMIFTDNPVDLLGFLDASPAAGSRFWQWQVNVRSSGGPWRPEATARRRRTYLTPKPARFGYASRGPNGERRAKGGALWWSLINPMDFLGELEPLSHVGDLLQFGLALRDWSNLHKLPVLASPGAYGTRLLKDSRFAAGWRRKVPAATNARLRPHLPGNHYQLVGKPALSYPRAHKFDQAAAHHHAALTIRFPHANELDARGWFRRPQPTNGARVHARGGILARSKQWEALTKNAGMFVIAIDVPEIVTLDKLNLPCLRRPGRRWWAITSVELEHIHGMRDQGVELGDIWCCWTSPRDDDRLREYSWWAQDQLRDIDERSKRWVKPLMLAAYGMLAVRPSKFRNAWRWCRHPDGAIGWHTRYGQLVGLERSTKEERESGVANVLWRALIESKVRLESLTFAQKLRAQGMRPLAIYADAVFATGRLPADSLPAPWRYEGEIHDLSFEAPSRYRSREETRLPGTPHRTRGEGGNKLVNPRS
jgi:hypothetical protein